MIVYFKNINNCSNEHIANVVGTRLAEEGNTIEALKKWLSDGYEQRDLSEFDYSNGDCPAVHEALAKGEVKYVVDIDGFYYVGRHYNN